MPENEKSAYQSGEVSRLIDAMEDEQTLEVTVRKGSDEIILRDPSDNKILKLRAVTDDHRFWPDEGPKTLTPEEFEDGVKRVYELGLEFSAELSPQVFLREDASADQLNGEELLKLQNKYPQLPREVGFVAHNSITGQDYGMVQLGGPDFLKKKEEVVRKYVINPKYKEDFFFKHALKIPYVKELDWEVVMKRHEKGVKDSVNIPYSLLRIVYADSDARIGMGIDSSLTLAIGRSQITSFIGILTELKAALDECPTDR